jgi:hypothetical protein
MEEANAVAGHCQKYRNATYGPFYDPALRFPSLFPRKTLAASTIDDRFIEVDYCFAES